MRIFELSNILGGCVTLVSSETLETLCEVTHVNDLRLTDYWHCEVRGMYTCVNHGTDEYAYSHVYTAIEIDESNV